MESIRALVLSTPTTGVFWVWFYSTLAAKIFNVRVVSDPAVHAGDRIAQLILERISTPEVEEVDVSLFFSLIQALEETARGSGGFGSTGGFTTQ